MTVGTGGWRVVALLAGLALSRAAVGEPVAAPTPGSRQVTVGIDAVLPGEDDAAVVEEAVRAALAGEAAPAPAVVRGCRDVTFCLTVVSTPIRLGGREGGTAVAAYVSRRLLVHPNWPWPQSATAAPTGAGSSPVQIEDTYTSSGNAACAPCQAELETLGRQVNDARTVAEPTMVDEGDLQLLVGPAGRSFLREAALTLAAGLRDRHLRPWLASLSPAP